jgi:hypothetical protein
MERTLAMDEGKFDMQVAWLAPAHKANPFQMIKDVDYHSAGGNLGSDEENADDSQNADAQMARGGGDPDVEPEADAAGRVAQRAKVPRAQPVAAQPQRPPNFFERLFGVKRQPAPVPTPPPPRRRF